MTRPSDSHWSLLTPTQKKNTRIILETLASERIDYVLGGGWAVYAQESNTPSIDCDVFTKRALPNRVVTKLSDVGIRVGPQGDLELLPLEMPMELLGTGEEDLRIPPVSYVPAEIFKGRLESRTLLLDKEVKAIPVPDRVALAVTKLCSLQGRSLAYRSFTDGEARMRLGPVATPQILSLGQSYYLRKAGKDLFDVSLLLAPAHAVDETRRLAGPDVWSVVRGEIDRLPTAVKDVGFDMARRVGRATSEALIQDLLT